MLSGILRGTAASSIVDRLCGSQNRIVVTPVGGRYVMRAPIAALAGMTGPNDCNWPILLQKWVEPLIEQ
jgi:hypothetical protein